jgi:hypothetical protein
VRSVSELEYLVLRAIRDGLCQSYLIRARVNSEAAVNFRQVDRALQNLRKRGEIVYSRKRGWEIARDPVSREH